jgi:hypothetical protein
MPYTWYIPLIFAQGWNFEKAHSILHKVLEIVMWGWSELTSCQGPEHAHIDLIKSVAHLTNNKDVFRDFHGFV